MATIDILIPTYNGARHIAETIKSILSQNYKDYRILICDDASKDNTLQIIRQLKDKRIIIFENNTNVGYPKNLERIRKYATADFIYLMGQDDIMASDALKNTIDAFKLSKNIGAVTRPYFWFDKNINIPVRSKRQLNPQKNVIVKITDDFQKVIRVFETLDQLSGLAYRRQFLSHPFHSDIFPCHVYPFASIFKKHPIVFLKDYNIAVRIASSQTRSLSSIYTKSPLLSWIEMVRSIYPEKKYLPVQKHLIKDFVTKNYVGLVQIRNYAEYQYLIREIWYLLKFNWQNIFNFSFWFFSLGCLITPAFILIPMVDWYKNKIYSKTLTKIKFEYKI